MTTDTPDLIADLDRILISGIQSGLAYRLEAMGILKRARDRIAQQAERIERLEAALREIAGHNHADPESLAALARAALAAKEQG